jgi:hypothetical protein
MVVKPFSQRIDPNKVFDIQNSQYSERLLLADTVPANSTKLGKVTVANLGHFFCQFITGSFSTLKLVAAVITDTGLSYLSGQLMDGSGQRKLFNEPIPLDLLLSPGRRKDPTSANVVADPASNGLFFPLEFEYMFTANSDILFNVVNTSDNPNSYEIVFHGIRVVSSMVVGNRIQPAGGQLTRTTVQPQRRG